jgi:hypothetical protein
MSERIDAGPGQKMVGRFRTPTRRELRRSIDSGRYRHVNRTLTCRVGTARGAVEVSDHEPGTTGLAERGNDRLGDRDRCGRVLTYEATFDGDRPRTCLGVQFDRTNDGLVSDAADSLDRPNGCVN